MEEKEDGRRRKEAGVFDVAIARGVSECRTSLGLMGSWDRSECVAIREKSKPWACCFSA